MFLNICFWDQNKSLKMQNQPLHDSFLKWQCFVCAHVLAAREFVIDSRDEETNICYFTTYSITHLWQIKNHSYLK